MKKFPLILSLVLIISLLAGCAGTPVVYYTNCTCPVGTHDAAPEASKADETPAPAVEGALKTGLYISTAVDGSTPANAEADGTASYNVLMAAVLVDDKGVIVDCIIDGISATVNFNAVGEITSDLTVAPQTKNELGDNYGMRVASSIGAEWNEQVAEIAKFAIGKTVEEFEQGAISETGKAPDGSDLATKATMYMSSYVNAVKMAAANAKHLGAEAGDVLKMGVITGISSSASATAEKAGNAQLDVDVTALTMNGNVITSCVIDAVQAKVAFDAAGVITSDISVPVATKNELGEKYGMVAWGKAQFEWNVQAAEFAAYVTDKTVEQVAGINITEENKPADVDLSAKVTIKINGFMDLIAKAAK